MAFGVTPLGFNKKTLDDVKTETTGKWQDKFGDGFDLDPRTPAGGIKIILDEVVSDLWDLGEDIYNQQIPNFAEQINLDNLVSLNGITRNPATKSTVATGRARGTFGTVLALGQVVSVFGNANSRFITDAAAIISNPSIDEVQKISFDANPDSGKFNIDFAEGTTGDINHDDSIPTIQSTLDTTLGVGNSVVTGSIDGTGLTIAFGGSLGGLPRAELTISGNTLLLVATPVVITPSTTTDGDKAKSDFITLTAEVTGPVAANATTLSVIETPVAGWDEFTNETDAELGVNIETDAELKLRRIQELQIAGAATLDAIRADMLAVDGVTAVVAFQNNQDVAIPAIDEEQLISLGGVVPDGGEYVLDFEGNLTAAIEDGITAAGLQTILEATTGIGVGNIDVSGNETIGFTCTFIGALAGTNVVAFIVDSNTLVDGITPVVVSISVPTNGKAALAPHTLDIIVEGGTDADIGVSLLGTVAGGINTIGDVVENPVDSQGFAQTKRFSRPIEVEVFVEVDLTTDSNIFPADGLAQVEALILVYGNALTIGKNVIVYGSDPNLSCSFQSIPGILDAEIRVSRDAGPPVTDSNLPFEARERPKFDSGRIVAIEL